MGNEPLWLLIERMRRALVDAARVSARVTERVKQLETSGDPPVELGTPAAEPSGKDATEPTEDG